MEHFSVRCNNCMGQVDSFSQQIKFLLLEEELAQQAETITLSCGCVIDFPDWQIDPYTGTCKIASFSGYVYIEFKDKEVLYEEDDE